MTSRSSIAAPILAVLAIVLPFALYVGGYFWLGERVDGFETSPKELILIIRRYPAVWMLNIYRPAAYVEAICRQVEVWPELSDE